MAQTRIRQDTQLGPSVLVDDLIAVNGTSQPAAVSLQDELNILRSTINRALNTSLTGKFTDPPATINGKTRGISQLNSSVDTLETKPLLFPVQSGAVISVPAAQNYVILSVSGNEAPSQKAAVAPASIGAVVAQSPNQGAAFAAHELTLQSGSNAQSPRNLVRLRAASDGQVVQAANDADIYGLLQVEGSAADGATFDDNSGSARVKISFVTINYQTMSFVAAAAGDIGGKSINYMYRMRQQWSDLPDDFDFTNSTFSELMNELDVTFTRAAANQMGPVSVPNSLLFQVANNKTFKVQDAGGAHDIFSVVPAAGANAVNLTPDSLAISTTATVTSTKGLSVSTGSQAISIGTTPGQVESAGLTLASTGTNPLKVTSGQAINFKDAYQTGSTWAGSGIPLSTSTAEWTAYRAVFGEASVLAGVTLAARNANHGKRYAAVIPATIPAGTVVTGAGGSPNIDQRLFDFTEVDALQDVNVLVNGSLLRGGTGASSNFDFYFGPNPANGEIIFNFPLYGGATPDIVTVEIFGAGSAP